MDENEKAFYAEVDKLGRIPRAGNYIAGRIWQPIYDMERKRLGAKYEQSTKETGIE